MGTLPAVLIAAVAPLLVAVACGNSTLPVSVRASAAVAALVVLAVAARSIPTPVPTSAHPDA
jgi:hypothetical protein